VLDRPEARADRRLFAAALVTAATVGCRVGIARARQLGEQAVTLARRLNDDRLLIDALATLGFVCHLAGDPKRGLPLGREAVQRARQLGDDVLLGMSLTNCLLCEALIDPAHAGPLFTEAIACTQRSGDYLFASFVNNNAGVYALRAGDIPAARAYLQHAAEAMREIGGEIIDLPVNTGWVQRHDHDPDGARSSFAAALRISRHIGDRSGIAYASLGLACLAADAGDWRRAAILHGVAQAFLGPTGQPWEELEARYRQDSLAQIRARLGQEQFEPAYSRGMALSFGEALDLASGKPSQPHLLV